MELLVSVPAIGQESAASILGEIGADMSCFPSAAHLASWAGLCPGNRQSGGKRLSGKMRKGNARLKATLAEVVWVLSRMKGNYLSAQYHRLARRLGKKKAVMAVSHSSIVIIYHLLHDKEPYSDLGATYFEELDKERIEKTSVRRLEGLGYKVTLQPREEVSAQANLSCASALLFLPLDFLWDRISLSFFSPPLGDFRRKGQRRPFHESMKN